MKRLFIFLILALLSNFSFAAQAVEPFGAIPSDEQVRYLRQEMEMFIHFTVNQYTGREWGNGKEDPRIFNPVNLDTDQWAKVAKECGFQRMVITAKHHDGFCLWPSKYTDHSVASSPYLDGKGDVVKEFSDSCEKFDIEKGFYLSPWDRNSPYYNQGQAYNDFYFNQLEELLTNYGEITQMWFDGARGEAAVQTYEFERFWNYIRETHPRALIFSDAGPDIRWIGNEKGFAGRTLWNTVDRSKYEIGDTRPWIPAYLNTGQVGAPDWVVGQADTSIRAKHYTQWFWHKRDKPKTVKSLIDIYFRSVGRGVVLMLNVPPNPQGRFDKEDVDNLYKFKEELDAIFDQNLIEGANITASNLRGDSEKFCTTNLIDKDLDSYWAVDDGIKEASLEITLPKKQKINVVSLSEPIRLGQRISKFKVEAFVGNKWKVIANETTIGNKRLIRTKLVNADKFRVVIEDSLATVCLSEIGLFYEKGRNLAKN